MTDFLNEIVAYKKTLLKDKEAFFLSIRNKLKGTTYSRYGLFRRQISRPGQVNLIAEIKKASPSKGVIRENFDLKGIAKAYVDNGAAAISVLTEDKYFLGKPMYVRQVSDHFEVPVLAKDFIVDEGQICEARFNGASAILLIVAILSDKQIKAFLEVAAKLDLDCLVEVHDEKELARALACGAEIIGINNRDLHTFKVDLKTAESLIPEIPEGKVIVAESGIRTHEDIQRLKAAGAHAVLIGETFMRADDIGSKVKEIMYGKG